TAAEEARQGMVTAKARAGEVDGARRSPDQWRMAEARAAEAHAAMGRGGHEPAAAAVQGAATLYERSEALPAQGIRTEEQRRKQQGAEQARDLMTRGRTMAEEAAAATLAADVWTQACARAAEAQTALERRDYADARRAYTAATGLFRQATEAAR